MLPAKQLFRLALCVVLVMYITGCATQKFGFMPGTLNESRTFDKMYITTDISHAEDSTYFKVQGDDIVLDFSNTVIDARLQRDRPNTFYGTGIHIYNSRNVTIRNLSLHGFKIAILAENVQNLRIENCNLSYNYRPKLYSKWNRESLSDWLYYHNNENDEWKRYGAAIYLKDCRNSSVKEVICQQGMNGLLMTRCDHISVWNSNFSYNSGLGIGLYRSSLNSIMHNKLDWNARGYSHGRYARGQDSAGILLYEQSSFNVIAYNSATHSGDGLFLWAGQHTMDTGLGGCDSNRIFRNDFSHSIANAIEVTFSSNLMYENKLNDSRYGVWGGYSHHSEIVNNIIIGCDVGIAIEHGNHNIIADNLIRSGQVGIQLWERKSQPEDWPYAQVRDVRSRNYALIGNNFELLKTAIDATGTDSVYLSGENAFAGVETQKEGRESSYTSESPSWIQPWRNASMRADPEPHLTREPPARLQGWNTDLPQGTLRGREYIIINEWGPYNFQYPNLVLRNKEVVGEQEVYTFAVFGPTGKWNLKSLAGFESISHDTGIVTDSFFAYRPLNVENPELILEYTGSQFIDQFGDTAKAGAITELIYREDEVKTDWSVVFFQYDESSDPLTRPDAFAELLGGPEKVKEEYSHLAFHWWERPFEGIASDYFAVRATADITTQEDEYTFQVESDDGIRLWVDGELILERWDIHTPMIDEATIPLSAGRHHVELEYFEATGLAVLDVAISPGK